jgi:Zn-dependent peptidase ImmA (M78 family)
MAGDAVELQIDANILGAKTREEERANAFAAAFLMPADQLRREYSGYASQDLIASLLGRYGVSLDSLAFRLHNVGLIDAATRNRIRSLRTSGIALRAGRTADLQARDATRTPGNVLQRAVDAYVCGHISIRPIAALLGADPDELLEELAAPRPATSVEEWELAL